MMENAIMQVLGWIVAALLVGLYVGERGRRLAAERWATLGSPAAPQQAVSMAPVPEAEDRLQEAQETYTEEMVERGTAEMMADAKARGLRVDERQIRRDVERMLSGQDVDGG